ncbi:hypothetical protein CPT_Seuss92 [Caulobacter phage Seuss]|uniref:Uncharacterized protein n=1 Tax=Caulobacter phage Seuss TaxID=1675601 RepID=A0A0K1LN25_9CAUD|nr:hypothetical protein HOR08_gp092 [Caulobacter phage Seuss]AKU43618.1 hypothetical protein CPT_Seuss92 [Caulobacter phage Seuss]
MSEIWTPAAARQAARDEYDKTIAAIDKVAAIVDRAEALSRDWPDRAISANFMSGMCYASLRLEIRPDQELGVANDTFAAVEAAMLELGGVSNQGMQDATTDWFIGKVESFTFDRFCYFSIYVGRHHWIGQPDAEGAVCTRVQVGTTKQAVHKTEYVEKPAYAVFCPGQPS